MASVETSETQMRGDKGTNVRSGRDQIGWCEGRWARGGRGARSEGTGTGARAKAHAHLDWFFGAVLGCVPRLPAAAMTPRRTTRALVARLGANCAVRDTGIAAVADMAAMVVEGPVDGLKAISCKYLSCFVRSVGFQGHRRKRADRARGYVARRARSLRRDREGVGVSLTAQRRRVAAVRRRHRMTRRSGKGGEKTLGDQPV